MSDLQKQMIEFSTMDLVSAVATSRKLSPTEAMAVVYKSPFFKKLQDPQTGLYRESKAYLLRQFQKESESATGGNGTKERHPDRQSKGISVMRRIMKSGNVEVQGECVIRGMMWYNASILICA